MSFSSVIFVLTRTQEEMQTNQKELQQAREEFRSSVEQRVNALIGRIMSLGGHYDPILCQPSFPTPNEHSQPFREHVLRLYHQAIADRVAIYAAYTNSPNEFVEISGYKC